MQRRPGAAGRFTGSIFEVLKPHRSETALSIHVALNHITHYRYDRLVNLGPQIVRLRPAPHSRTQVLSYSLRIEPVKHFINWQQDPFSNYQARLIFQEPTREFKVTVDMVVDMVVHNPFDFFLEPAAEEFPFQYQPAMARDLAPYLVKEPLTPLLGAYLAKIDRTRKRTIEFLVGLNQQLKRDISYSVRMEPGVQTPEKTLALAWGSCRDTSWLLVQLSRHLGLAARFVSGYLIQLKADVRSLDGPSGAESDLTDLHAWCEVFLPGAGWVGLDPTSGLMAGEGHIPLACTPEPSSAAPVEGGVEESGVEFSHLMGVRRIYESPRVTAPYTQDQWAGVLALGEAVDRDLADDDVRLTIGGKPTFVASTDRDAAEWNFDALGPTKRGYATELARKLRAEYGKGGFLHFGQGKWYSGEQLPRWTLSIFWRKDGEPVWKNPALFADERQPCSYSADDAARFTATLAERLGLKPDFITPGFEDVWYYLWRERRLPVDVDPFDSKLDDAIERKQLARVFMQGLDSVVGYVLPLKATDSIAGSTAPDAAPAWTTGPWLIRGERMYLTPGDSPMGYRLPPDSAPSDAATVSSLGAGAHARIALCVEVRAPQRTNGPTPEPRIKKEADAKAAGQAKVTTPEKGALYIFMPPLERLQDYLELLTAVEATAQTLDVRIVLEGHPPPRDQRLEMLQVKPEPGVIKVSLHPAHNWGELVANTEFLYRVAQETHLSAEKFMSDGRHTGTGGGNHFALGGARADDSPFLRRPELLASLIAYWHNHPSLSYLFSGMFIGPASPSPRVDEACNEQPYELEIALREIQTYREKHGRFIARSPQGALPPSGDGEPHEVTEPWGEGRSAGPLQARPIPSGGRELQAVSEHGSECFMPPSMVDRTLRNLLVDVAGNPHRSEFCIDKLYSPKSSTGRLGLLELRAFEMLPDARMSIAQQLLLRALVARFWNKPYHGPMTRWGTALHDRFLLPGFVRMDFKDVLTELNESGYVFEMAWFEPHFEFRFPVIGKVNANSIELTLRSALEPWRVAGEEGTPRYIDSSLERIEVHVTGLNDNRYVVTVNGCALPLQGTGRAGEYVAGVRYKAWNPPSSLHPSIGVQTPLTFDIVDTWMERSLGGCQYHVAHPGGVSYATLPVNSNEAESRRLTRFLQMGHTPGRMHVQPAQPSREFPFTLDLRYRGTET